MNWSIFPYGAYVAFAFACIMFGGLAYRQIIDMLDLRAEQTGEDLDLFLSAPGALILIVFGLLLIPIGWMCYGTASPTIWKYALPLIGMVQIIQLSLRLYFQRLRLRTRAIVIRFMLRSGCVVIRFDEIERIVTQRSMLWSTITIYHRNNKASSFRIFPLSEAVILQRVQALSGVEALVHDEHKPSS
jgi:hypothetical protein